MGGGGLTDYPQSGTVTATGVMFVRPEPPRAAYARRRPPRRGDRCAALSLAGMRRGRRERACYGQPAQRRSLQVQEPRTFWLCSRNWPCGSTYCRASPSHANHPAGHNAGQAALLRRAGRRRTPDRSPRRRAGPARPSFGAGRGAQRLSVEGLVFGVSLCTAAPTSAQTPVGALSVDERRSVTIRSGRLVIVCSGIEPTARGPLGSPRRLRCRRRWSAQTVVLSREKRERPRGHSCRRRRL